jgi:hypothetical protein
VEHAIQILVSQTLTKGLCRPGTVSAASLAPYRGPAVIEAGYSAPTGEYGLVWQTVSLVLTITVELVGFLAGFTLVVQMFGWRSTRLRQDVNPGEAFPRDLFLVASKVQQEIGANCEAGSKGAEIRGTWLPHPDDPPSAEAS